MLRFDYSGTGSSGGRFEDGTLSLWLEEALAAIDQLTQGPLIVVGSSMGGWIALHLALLRPERVQALVGIAAAPDFTDWGFTAEQAAQLTDGRPMTRGFLGVGPAAFAARTTKSRSIARCAYSMASAIPRCRSRSPSGPCVHYVQAISS